MSESEKRKSSLEQKSERADGPIQISNGSKAHDENLLSARLSKIKLYCDQIKKNDPSLSNPDNNNNSYNRQNDNNEEDDLYDYDDDDEDFGDADASFTNSDSSSDSDDGSEASVFGRRGLRFMSLNWEPYDADEYEESFNRTQLNSDAEDADADEMHAHHNSTDINEINVHVGDDEATAMQLSSLLRSRLRKINSRNNSPMHDAPKNFDLYLNDALNKNEHQKISKRKTRRAHHDFDKGPLRTRVECLVCFTPIKQLHARMCCEYNVCSRCMRSYIEEKVKLGRVDIECPNDQCTKLIHRDEIIARLSTKALKEKFNQFLVDANNQVNVKTCPRCSHIKRFDLQVCKSSKTRPRLVTCDKCDLQWCFTCHAPWHQNLKCSQFMKGDVFLKKWAKEECKGQKNAQRCPKCKVFIQRSKGCDHMTCSQCKTEFCYKCGEKFRKLIFLGDHHSKYSVLGCKYRLMPEKTAKRKMIRGSILGGKLLVAPVVGSLALVAGVVVLGLGCIALPIYGTYRLVKYAKKRKLHSRNLSTTATDQYFYQSRFPAQYEAPNPLMRHWRRSERVELPVKNFENFDSFALAETLKWTEQSDSNSNCTNKRESNSSLNTERTGALSTSMCTDRSDLNLRV